MMPIVAEASPRAEPSVASVHAVAELDSFSVPGAIAAVVPAVSPVGRELRATVNGSHPAEQSSSATVTPPEDTDLPLDAGEHLVFLDFALFMSWDGGHNLLPDEGAVSGTSQRSVSLVDTEKSTPRKRLKDTSEEEDAAEAASLTEEPPNQVEREEIPFDRNQVLPKASGPLANFLPFDPAALDLAVQQVVHQIDDLGEELTGLLQGMGLSPWFMAAAVAAAAYEIARRQLQWSQLRQALPGEGHGPGSLWFPDSADPSSGERS